MTDIDQFVIAADPGLLRPLLDILSADAEVAVLSVARDERNDPERLVVAMEPQRAVALGDALGDRVVIESNSPVDPL